MKVDRAHTPLSPAIVAKVPVFANTLPLRARDVICNGNIIVLRADSQQAPLSQHGTMLGYVEKRHSSPRFVIGYMSLTTSCNFSCPRGSPHTVRSRAKTIQHVEYPRFEVKETQTFYRAADLNASHMAGTYARSPYDNHCVLSSVGREESGLKSGKLSCHLNQAL